QTGWSMKMNVFARVLFFVFVFGSLGHAQSPEGSLVGTVADTSGARIIGATVTVSAKSFSLVRSAKTGQVGEFTIESLPPGQYEVKVEAQGFAIKNGSVT